MLTIDGSQGEGGGQILRSSLALSMATGLPFRITGIRAGRAKPGLMRQHLTCVQAAATICGATITGASVGSQEVSFAPGRVRAGVYHFPIGTAGGTCLVLQAILPALFLADGPSSVVVEGGTHTLAAPPFEFFDRALVPLLRRTGVGITARLERAGFYPAGGGRIVIEVEPTRQAQPLRVPVRGNRLSIRATAVVSQLTRSIAIRELEILRDRLGLADDECEVVVIQNPVGPGNVATVELRYEHVTEVMSAVGRVGKSAEEVAREIADQVREYIASQRPVGQHLADQLMVPLAVLAGGEYAAGELTPHAVTNVEIMRAFGIGPEIDAAGTVRVKSFR